MEKFRLPAIASGEVRSRQAVLELLEASEGSVFLEAVVERIEFSRSIATARPVFKLVLLIKLPEVFEDLPAFHAYISRAFIAPVLPSDPFWFEEALGPIKVPWGDERTEPELQELFASWVGRGVLAEVRMMEYMGVERVHVVALRRLSDERA